MGVGEAIKSGYKKAYELDMDISAVMAGDAQMDPKELDKLLDPIIDNNAEYTKGNRLTHKEKMKMPKIRAFGNGILTFLTKISSGYWNIIDPQNGYTAISKKAISSLDFNKIYKGYGVPNDILIQLNIANMRVMDVEMAPVYGEEKSGIKIGRYSLRLTFILIKGFFRRIWRKYGGVNFHPLFLFYAVGLVLFPMGLIFSLFVLYFRFKTGDYSIGTITLTTLLLIMGMQSFIFAMFFDMESNKDLSGKV